MNITFQRLNSIINFSRNKPISYLLLTSIVLASYFLISISPVFAGIPLSDELNPQGAFVGATFRVSRPETVIMGAIQLIVVIAGLIFFFCIVWGAFEWLTAGGDKSQTQAARSRITGCLVGLSIVALAWAIMLLVQYFFGVNLFPTP